MDDMDESELINNLDAKITALKIAVNQFPLLDRPKAVQKVQYILKAFFAHVILRDSSKNASRGNLPSSEQLMSPTWTDLNSHISQKIVLKYAETPNLSSVADNSDSSNLPTKKIRGRPKLGRVHMCPQCSRTFKRPCLLKQHISSSHLGSLEKKLCSQCEQCGRLFSTSIGLNAHRKRYHEVDRQVYRCPKCTFATFSQSSFDKHMKKLHGPDSKLNSVCDICGKGFVTRNQLKMHREIHSADKKYKCRECPFATNTLSGLRSHSYAQHNPRARLYHCTTCNKEWKKQALYKSHMEKQHCIKIPVDKKPGPKSVCESTPTEHVEKSITTLTPVAPPLSNMPEPPGYAPPTHETTIPLPVMCTQMTSNDMNFMPQGFNTQTPKLGVDFNVDQTIQKSTHDGVMPLINPSVTLPQNIPVASVLDDLLNEIKV